MRIAIDVRSLMEGRHSGVEEYTVELIYAIQRVAPQHQLVLWYNSARFVTLPDFGEKVEIKSFNYPNKLFNAWQFVTNSPKWDKMLEADVWFVPNFRLAPLSPHAPLVVTVHDLSFEHFPELFSVRRRVWHKMMRPQSLVERADRVIAVSEATKDDIVSLYGANEEKVAVIYSGVVGLKSGQAGELAKYKIPLKYLLYLGTLEPRKNVSSIVRAFDEMADEVEQDLVIAGESGWLMSELEATLATMRHRRRVHLIGFVEEEDKTALYAAADLFVYPSLYEGFGFPPLEALLAGTPVITSYNSSLPEVVGDWATLIDPYDTAELALVMKELLNDLPEVTETMKQNIRDKYSWDRAARQTLDIIERVV